MHGKEARFWWYGIPDGLQAPYTAGKGLYVHDGLQAPYMGLCAHMPFPGPEGFLWQGKALYGQKGKSVFLRISSFFGDCVGRVGAQREYAPGRMLPTWRDMQIWRGLTNTPLQAISGDYGQVARATCPLRGPGRYYPSRRILRTYGAMSA